MANETPVSNQVNVINPSGDLVSIPEEQMQDAVRYGYRAPSADELKGYKDQQAYGTGTGNELLAGAAGAARAATFGLSDAVMTKTGAVKPETLAGLEKYNPTASAVGTGVGIIAPLILAPEGELVDSAATALKTAEASGDAAKIAEASAALKEAKGTLNPTDALNPVRAVSKIGSGIADAASPLAEKAAGLVANPETSPIAHRILSQAGAQGLGSAVEGAAYGLGQSVSEDSLGDPDALGEKLLSHVGWGAFIGGGLGAFIGGGLGALIGGATAPFTKGGEIVPKMVSEVDRPLVESGDFTASVNASPLTSEEKESIIDGLRKEKDNAQEIRDAAAALGAPVLEGQTSASPLVQKAESLLLNGPPTYSSMKRQALAVEGVGKAEAAVQDTVGGSTPMTKAELGQKFQESLASKVSEENEPIKQLYDEIKQHYEAIPLSEKSAPSIARNIKSLDEVRISPSSPQASIANRVADEIGNLKTVDDVKQYRSMLNQSLSPTASSGEKRMVAILSDKLKNLEENSVVRFAENNMKTGKARDRILSLLDQREAANASYSKLMGKVENLADALGKRKVYGPKDFIDFLQDLTPEKVTDKLFTKNNSGFLKFFSQEFPEEMALMRQYQKGVIHDAAIKTGTFKPNEIFKRIDAMEPEIKKAIFSPEELKKLEQAKTYLRSMPANVNPSGTSHATAFRSFFEHPTGAAIANIRDYGLEKFLTLAGDSAEKSKVAGLSTLERLSQGAGSKIANGAKAIFTTTGKVMTPTAVLGTEAKSEKRKNYQDVADKLQQLNSNPEQMIDTVDSNSRPLFPIAPNTTAALQQASVRATQFLASKLPQPPEHKPLSAPYEPSNAEKAKFQRYMDAVEHPTRALDQVKNGTLNPETVETLQTVYPKLYSQMQAQVMNELMEHVGKKKPIPYRMRLSLGTFLGQDLDNSLNPASIQSNQVALANMGKEQEKSQAGIKPSQKGLSGLSASNQLLTPMQSNSHRGNS